MTALSRAGSSFSLAEFARAMVRLIELQESWEPVWWDQKRWSPARILISEKNFPFGDGLDQAQFSLPDVICAVCIVRILRSTTNLMDRN